MGSTQRKLRPNIDAKNEVLKRAKRLLVKSDSMPKSILPSSGNAEQTVVQLRKTLKAKTNRMASRRLFCAAQSFAWRQDFFISAAGPASAPVSRALAFW